MPPSFSPRPMAAALPRTVISCRMGAAYILNEFMRLLFHSEQPQNSTILGGRSHSKVNYARALERAGGERLKASAGVAPAIDRRTP